MIKLAICNVKDLDLSKSYPLLSKKRKEKVDYYKFDKDKRLSAGAYLLLKKLLLEEHINYPIFKEEKYGKLSITNYDDIYFNISHSKHFVACVISDKEVGVDIEYNDPEIDLSIAKHYFYNREYESIIESSNSSDEFFKYWVLKESYMKYTGYGFKLPLNSFEIVIEKKIRLKNDTKNINFNLFDTGNYKLAVASNYNVTKYIQYNTDELY